MVSNFDRPRAEDDNRHEPPRSSDASHGRHHDASTTRRAAIGELISVEALVNVMLRKGLCTEAELLDEERRHRGDDGQGDSQYVRIGGSTRKAENWSRPQHPLRRIFSKYRWSRHLGSALFGWKWKKLKRDHSAEKMP